MGRKPKLLLILFKKSLPSPMASAISIEQSIVIDHPLLLGKSSYSAGLISTLWKKIIMLVKKKKDTENHNRN